MEVFEEDSPKGMEEELEENHVRQCLEEIKEIGQEEEWSIPASVAGRNDSLVE